MIKDPNGSPVVINPANVAYIGAAMDAQSRQPILGMSAIIFIAGGGVVCAVMGSPEDIGKELGFIGEVA